VLDAGLVNPVRVHFARNASAEPDRYANGNGDMMASPYWPTAGRRHGKKNEPENALRFPTYVHSTPRAGGRCPWFANSAVQLMPLGVTGKFADFGRLIRGEP
jgi:hypothetical protein